MTISNTTRFAGPFVGNGTASSFGFSFKVFSASDLAVYRTVTSTGIATTLALTTDYTVALNADQDSSPGGTVTLVAGNLASGLTLVIASAVPNTQQVILTNQGGFYPEVLNDALDKATAQVQQVQAQANRSISFPAAEVSAVGTLPIAVDRAGQYLAFDANGNVDIGGAVPDQRYYGGKTADPTTRNDGTAMQAGDLYYNTASNAMKVYSGTAWIAFTSAVTDGDKGDITISGGGSIYSIDAGSVTYAKMQNVSATDRLLGRDMAGAGSVEELTATGGIEFTGTGIRTSAFTGDVTKSAGGTVLTIASGSVTSAKLGSSLSVSGNFTLTNGNLVVADTNGIDFSATAGGSGTPTSEILTDFEEGTWAPVYEPATGAFTTMTMDVVSAHYTKIGKLVIANAHIRTDSVTVGTASGNLYVSGLPYPSGNVSGSGTVSAASAWSTDHPGGLHFDAAGASRAVLTYRNTAGNSATTAIQVSDLTAGATADRNVLIFSLAYWTA